MISSSNSKEHKQHHFKKHINLRICLRRGIDCNSDVVCDSLECTKLMCKYLEVDFEELIARLDKRPKRFK